MSYLSKQEKNAADKRRYDSRKSSQRCVDCGVTITNGASRCDEHLAKAVTRSRIYQERNITLGLCIKCGSPAKTKNHCPRCQENNRASQKKYSNKRYNCVMDHYGRACTCCGEKNLKFLTIDHINGNGKSHRRNCQIYQTLYADFKLSGIWSEEVAVLCYNCNCGRYRNGGTCPHKDVEVKDDNRECSP